MAGIREAIVTTMTSDDSARPGTPGEVFLAFLGLGLTSFGGPTAHLGYFRAAFVAKRNWIGDSAYSDLVALCQFLPGPASSQVGIAIGLMRAGIFGAVAAFIGFTLPSVALLVGFAWGLDTTGWLTPGMLSGLKIAALAVVAQAVIGMAPALAPDRPRQAIALCAAIGLLVFPGAVQQVAVIAASAAIGLALPASARPPDANGIAAPKLPGLPFLAAFLMLLIGLPVLAGFAGDPRLDLVDSFYRAGSLVFGGGHVVLPLLDEAVVATGLVGADAFLAGYGAAQAVPGPLFSFAAYLGYVADGRVGGVSGAALALCAIYLPSFLLVFGVLPFWSRLSGNRQARAALNGANAGVLGILAAALYTPVFTGAVAGPLHAALAASAYAALTLGRLPPWLVVIACGLAGLVLWPN